jgi:hypothetical protein
MAEEALKMQSKNSHSLDPRFIKNLKGKDFVLYSGLLDLAHQIGIQSIQVEPVQYPTAENGNEGICKAIVTSADGRTFTEIGDANPKNVNVQISVHVLRMAATRAKGRALRDFTNIGMTCLEELGDSENTAGSDDPKVIPMRPKPKNQRSSNDSPKTENTETKAQDQHPEKTTGASEAPPKEKSTDARISTAQRNAILSLSKSKGILEDDLVKQIQEIFGVEINVLSATDASNYIKTLQKRVI